MKLALPKLPQGLLMGWGLSLLLLVLSYLRIAGNSKSALFEHAAFQAVFEGPILGTRLASLIGWFAFTQVALHMLYGTACWLMAALTRRAFPGKDQSLRSLTAVWFLLGTFCLLAWNSGEYPRSSLGSPYAAVAGTQLLGLPLYAWLAILFSMGVLTVTVMAALRTARQWPPAVALRRSAWIGLPVLGMVAAMSWPLPSVAPAPAGKPNIIFLGIDSLRYDEVRREHESDTPAVDHFLTGAVRMDNAMTPLARTFPSWVSLLTGRHPHSTGAILNLLPPGQMNRGPTLPEILREHGYHTAYAIDEVRFSNIDASYGFDQAETPRIGSADFILGIASDTPLLNLVVNTRAGKWLFPYSHANRGMASIYDPDAFVARVRNDIHLQSPMFLAVHLTLPHWPYQWRDSPRHPPDPGAVRPDFYQDAVRRADGQFGAILESLGRRGMLENAIVIAFSDHGESFAPTDALVQPGDPLLAQIQATPAWGHGTTVLTPHQYRVFLALRAYGPAQQWLANAGGTSHVPASLEDITPTLLEALGIPAKQKLDGVSLLAELRAGETTSPRLAQRVRFTETEFNPLNLVQMTGDVAAVNASSLAEATRYYRVDPVTDRIEMKTKFLDTLRRNRQFAAVGWSQLLGAFPRPLDDSYEFLAVNLQGGLPRRIDTAAGFAADPEISQLWLDLCARYGSIIDSGKQPIHCQAVATTASN